MAEGDVRSAWGPRTKVNRTIVSGQIDVQWVYDGGRVGFEQYVYLRNGVLTSIRTPGER